MRQYTSMLSFENNKDKLKYLGDKVYGLIVDSGNEGISNHEIAHELQIETATVSGLTRPLVKNGLVEQAGKRKCKITGNLVIAWKVKIKNTLF